MNAVSVSFTILNNPEKVIKDVTTNLNKTSALNTKGRANPGKCSFFV